MELLKLSLLVTYISGALTSFGLMAYTIIEDHRTGEDKFKWVHLLTLVITTILSWIIVGVYIGQEPRPISNNNLNPNDRI